MNLKSSMWSLLAVFAFSMVFCGCSDDDDPIPQPEQKPTPDEPVKPEEPEVPLTFALEVSEVTDHSAVFRAVPSNDEDSYYANILPASVFENRTDAELMEMFARDIKTDALRRGTLSFTYDQLTDNTDYIFFAFGFAEGKPTTEQIAKSAFATLESQGSDLPSDGPEVYLNARYETSDRMFYADMKCLSQDASAASFTVEVADALDLMLQDMKIEYLMDPANGFAVDFTPELLAIFNGKGFDHEGFVGWTPELDGLYVAALLMARNDKGQTIVRSEALMGTTPRK